MDIDMDFPRAHCFKTSRDSEEERLREFKERMDIELDARLLPGID